MSRVFFFLLLFPAIALAHPADDLCTGDKLDIRDNCIAPFHHLGLDNPEYYACWREYQHERRELDKCMREINETLGAINALTKILELPALELPNLVANYWDVIPMEVLSRYPGDLDFCETQIKAARATMEISETWLNIIKGYLSYYELNERVSRVVIQKLCCDKKGKHCKTC